MDYGCDVSNRYTGYLDSSDHGNTLGSSTGKNKRRTKKKRKPKHHKLVDKCINTDDYVNESHEIGDTATTINNQQSFENDRPCDDINYENKSAQHESETELSTTDCPESLTSSYGSPTQSDMSKDEVKGENGNGGGGVDEQDDDSENTIENISAPQNINNNNNNNETKWSEICFEEEKSLMAMESQSNDDKKSLIDSDLVVYPTVYFYNSNFGNRIRRTVDWYDSDRRSKNNETEFEDRNDEGTKKKRHHRNARYRKKNSGTETNENKDLNTMAETRSNDAKTKTHNESTTNDRSSQHTNEQSNKSNHRGDTNTKNRYNKLMHGMPQRTFTRRRPDFVRNV